MTPEQVARCLGPIPDEPTARQRITELVDSHERLRAQAAAASAEAVRYRANYDLLLTTVITVANDATAADGVVMAKQIMVGILVDIAAPGGRPGGAGGVT